MSNVGFQKTSDFPGSYTCKVLMLDTIYLRRLKESCNSESNVLQFIIVIIRRSVVAGVNSYPKPLGLAICTQVGSAKRTEINTSIAP